jgi:hypothetical protein
MSKAEKHVIEAGNPLMGSARFFSLSLPSEWKLAAGVGRPEVNASQLEGELRWVANGSFWYVLHHPVAKWALEFHCHIRPVRTSRMEPNGDHVIVGSHEAIARWETRRRGLPWQRHDVHFLTVDFTCPQSSRSIRLQFSGWCPKEGFQQILEALQNVQCH